MSSLEVVLLTMSHTGFLSSDPLTHISGKVTFLRTPTANRGRKMTRKCRRIMDLGVSQEKADPQTADRFTDSSALPDPTTSLFWKVCAYKAGGIRQTFRSQTVCVSLRHWPSSSADKHTQAHT